MDTVGIRTCHAMNGELLKIAFTASLMNYERANNIYKKKNLIGINILFKD